MTRRQISKEPSGKRNELNKSLTPRQRQPFWSTMPLFWSPWAEKKRGGAEGEAANAPLPPQMYWERQAFAILVMTV